MLCIFYSDFKGEHKVDVTPVGEYKTYEDFIEIPTGDYITITKDEDFTIDMFLYPTTLGSDDGIALKVLVENNLVWTQNLYRFRMNHVCRHRLLFRYRKRPL